MPLKKSTGNMYPWVSHTHAHLAGECENRCSYCYVSGPEHKRPKLYSGPYRLVAREFEVSYGRDKTIFVEHCNDLFAQTVPPEFIRRVLAHCCCWPDNTFVFQTKNPVRLQEFGTFFPPAALFGITLETNRDTSEIGNAPTPSLRADAFARFTREGGARKFITLEPILDFDVGVLLNMILRIEPEFVNIGADSKGHNLPEPSGDKVVELIRALREVGIHIKQKRNLVRILTREQLAEFPTE